MDDELLRWNSWGLIPGPDEQEQDFRKRVDYCLNLKEHLTLDLKAYLSSEESSSPELLAPANDRLRTIYDITIDWIPIFFSNHKLSFWHGGCAWIFQMTDESPTTALIQLRSSLRYRDKYLGIYQRDELITHELCHVGRMMFQEPHYEEFLSYRTSCSRFSRWFGPIVKSSIESVLFLLLLFVIVVFDIFLVTLQHHEAYMMALWLKMVPVALVGCALWRLYKRHRTINRTLSHLEQWLGSSDKANCVVYRLKDSEIEAFAEMSVQEIADYAAVQVKEELRWRVITQAYKI